MKNIGCRKVRHLFINFINQYATWRISDLGQVCLWLFLYKTYSLHKSSTIYQKAQKLVIDFMEAFIFLGATPPDHGRCPWTPLGAQPRDPTPSSCRSLQLLVFNCTPGPSLGFINRVFMLLKLWNILLQHTTSWLSLQMHAETSP